MREECEKLEQTLLVKKRLLESTTKELYQAKTEKAEVEAERCQLKQELGFAKAERQQIYEHW